MFARCGDRDIRYNDIDRYGLSRTVFGGIAVRQGRKPVFAAGGLLRDLHAPRFLIERGKSFHRQCRAAAALAGKSIRISRDLALQCRIFERDVIICMRTRRGDRDARNSDRDRVFVLLNRALICSASRNAGRLCLDGDPLPASALTALGTVNCLSPAPQTEHFTVQVQLSDAILSA